MNMNAQAYDQYKRVSVETLAPEKLLLLLFEGAIKNLVNAQKAIEEKDINTAHNEILRAEDILIELMSTLKMDYEISKSLYSLYDYMYGRLVEANLQKDPSILAEVEGLVRELCETFQQASHIARTQHRPEQVPVKPQAAAPGVSPQAPVSGMRQGINVQG